MHTHTYTTSYVLFVEIREQLVGVGSLHHVNDQIQVIRLSGTHVLYLLNHLADPHCNL